MNRERWLKYRLLNGAQSVLLVGALAGLLAWLGAWVGGPAMAWMAFSATLVLYWVSPNVAPSTVLLGRYRARVIHPAEAPGLYETVRRLSERAGLAARPRLYLQMGGGINAFTLGARDDAAIVIGDGLLQTLSRRELTGVLAHEISHIAHGDLRLMSFADLAGRVTLALAWTGQLLIIASLPALLLGEAIVGVGTILLLLLAPTVSALLQLALSRVREFNADLTASHLLGDPGPLIDGLRRLEMMQRRVRGWDWFTLRPGGGNGLLRTHPATPVRIARLESLHQDPSFPWDDPVAPPGPRGELRDPGRRRIPVIAHERSHLAAHRRRG